MAYDRSRPRVALLVASAGLCVLVFAVRLVYEVPGGGFGLLYVLPIVLVAQEYYLRDRRRRCGSAALGRGRADRAC